MNTLEQDVARVEAVAAALGGPLTVWVVEWHTKNDEGFRLYRTKEQALKEVLGWFDAYAPDELGYTKREYAQQRAKLLNGTSFGFTNDDEIWAEYNDRMVE